MKLKLPMIVRGATFFKVIQISRPIEVSFDTLKPFKSETCTISGLERYGLSLSPPRSLALDSMTVTFKSMVFEEFCWIYTELLIGYCNRSNADNGTLKFVPLLDSPTVLKRKFE